jgi:hydrogenase maturation protein HypF
MEEGVSLLKRGYILAVKGLGGFHLAADAENQDAVNRLRKRKRRAEKPFALMCRDVAAVRRFALVSTEEETLLLSPQRPIVLLPKMEPNTIAEAVAPRNRYFGVMLPYTPLHFLLLDRGFSALVMTSGNLSEEPIVIDSEEAFARLAGVADYFLIHNRAIYQRMDDSIVKRTAGKTRFIRRSRGYVPTPVFLKAQIPSVLACGGHLKSTVCLTKDDRAYLSQHIGDLEDLSSYEFFRSTIQHLKHLLAIDPEFLAHDLHPDYLSTQYALEQGDVQRFSVQHHHAHVVSCMAENGIEGPVIGLAFDGTGYGTDGKVWGGEILFAETTGFQRAAHLAYIPMPGGSAAIQEPWRMAASYLYRAFGDGFLELDIPAIRRIEPKRLKVIKEMISRGFNAPETSSLGRLFDGVAALLGIRDRVSFEGQAAMELEMLAGETTEESYDYEWISQDGSKILSEPIIRGVVRDILKGHDPSRISGKFHATLIRLFVHLCEALRKDSGLDRVVLSGGAFQNSILLRGMVGGLEKKDFRVYTHHQVPANDGGLSLGQAVVAAALSDHTSFSLGQE